jgi:release factor glutamine methyltransferase
MMNVKELFVKMTSQILHYDTNEAKEIVFLILNDLFGISKNDLILETIVENVDLIKVQEIVNLLNEHVPVQYIIQKAWFRDRPFFVNKQVLIPRPETEQIVDLIMESKPSFVLDLGTGSGCIAISAALEANETTVFAIDISNGALEVAKRNALNLNAKVEFQMANILDFQCPFQQIKFDLIVSNPPYVKKNEMSEIRENVKLFEPHLALFVEDENPLIYYQKIAEIAKNHLTKLGQVLVEINSNLGRETEDIFKKAGFLSVEIIQDFFGRDRFLRIK